MAPMGNGKPVGGKLVDVTLEPTMREALLFKKRLYDEGLIPPDYAVMKDNQYWDLATSGRARYDFGDDRSPMALDL